MKTGLIYRRLHGAATWLAAILAPLFLVQHAKAFALMGPYADWMQPTNGFVRELDIGGPMNIGEGYRWNVPVVTYAFDPSFVEAFGTNGVAAVESAIAILNNLPPASQLDPSNFPLYTIKQNVRASSQSLIDLKSTTLSLLLQQLGLSEPTRYTYALHDFSVTHSITNGNFVQRNFDPFLLVSTNAVNAVLYRYFLQEPTTLDTVVYEEWFTFPLDPMDPFNTAVADLPQNTSFDSGSFVTQLTRDDVGGLRYLLRPDNYALEMLLPDVHGIGTNSSSYINLALRAGVDKITFIRQDYDPLTQQAYGALTNDYIDAYLTNNVLIHQQLERVVSKPDFIFSAFEPINNRSYLCTGTSNWLNNSALNGNADGEGPGTIPPPVSISFPKYGLVYDVETADSYPTNPQSVVIARWGSFDDSTNPPVIFADSAASLINNLEVNIEMIVPDGGGLGWRFDWNLPVNYGESAILQSSTNLVNWVPQATITNYGMPTYWNHTCVNPQEFFRAVPQTNSQ